MLQHQCENYTIDRSDKVEDKEIKKEEAQAAEEATKDFETTEGAQEAGSEDTKKKVKKSKQEIKIEELEAQLEKLKADTKKDREAYYQHQPRCSQLYLFRWKQWNVEKLCTDFPDGERIALVCQQQRI